MMMTMMTSTAVIIQSENIPYFIVRKNNGRKGPEQTKTRPDQVLVELLEKF